MNKLSRAGLAFIMTVLLVALYLLIVSQAAVSPNIIRWTTQSEDSNYGYDIYRGPDKQGPFERINSNTITGAGTTDIPQHYEYRDETIQADTVYWYYVESISLAAERQRATPVYASKPKSASLW